MIGEGRYLYFRTGPAFCGFADNIIEIAFVAKRAKAGMPAEMNMICKSQSKGYTGAGIMV